MCNICSFDLKYSIDFKIQTINLFLIKISDNQKLKTGIVNKTPLYW